MAVRIRLRRGSAAAWTSANPILQLGEEGKEMDTGFSKTGNGTSAWNDLEYDTIPYATELTPGAVTRATNAEVLAGSGNLTYVTPAAAKNLVDSEIALLILNAPEAIDTLDELAAALGDDPNFATTVSTLIGLRVLYADIIDNLLSTDPLKVLSAAQGKILKDAVDLRLLISNIVDNVTDTSTNKALSANQGKLLKDAVDLRLLISNIVDNVTDTATNKALSANQGKLLKDAVDLRLLISNIVDNLADTSTNKALSAAQGKILSDTKRNLIQRVVTVSDATSITPNGDTSDMVYQANTQTLGTLTLNAPSGTPTDGQNLILKIKSTNAHSLSFNAIYLGSVDLTLPTTVSGASKYDYLGFRYSTQATKWHLVSKNFGF